MQPLHALGLWSGARGPTGPQGLPGPEGPHDFAIAVAREKVSLNLPFRAGSTLGAVSLQVAEPYLSPATLNVQINGNTITVDFDPCGNVSGSGMILISVLTPQYH